MRSAQSHFISITKRIGKAARYRDIKELAEVISSDAYVEALAAFSPKQRISVAVQLADAWKTCEAKAPLVPTTKAKVSWAGNDLLLARLRKLAPLYPDDAELAKAMGGGLVATQVRLARARYVDKPAAAHATVPDRIAA